MKQVAQLTCLTWVSAQVELGITGLRWYLAQESLLRKANDKHGKNAADVQAFPCSTLSLGSDSAPASAIPRRVPVFGHAPRPIVYGFQ